MQTADEKHNKNENIYHFPRFPGMTTVKVWHCFAMSHTNPNVESYSVPVTAKTRMLQSQINHNKYIRTQELFTRNKYFFKNLCYQTENFNIKRN